jgi:predicted ATPase
VRELAERGVLRGNRGGYVSMADVGEVSVPATLQATIAARIDRLDPAAKRTLSAAAVIGSRFSRGLLETLGIDPVLQDLLGGELIDQVRFTREPEYVFHHPLIRAVAYESQLKSDRAELHRRVAAAIEARDPAAAEENAALIAEHLEAAGDLPAAYGWHMRRNVGHQPRHKRRPPELGACRKDRRRIARRGPQPGGHAHCPAHHVVRDRLASPGERCRGPV